MPFSPVNTRPADVSASTMWRVPKTVWHPLSLQQLPPSRFVRVVNKILDGQYTVVAETPQVVSVSPVRRL